MIITISGPAGSGKSTAASMLSKEAGLPAVDVGVVFRTMAKKRGMSLIEFGLYASRKREIDSQLDQQLMRRAKHAKPFIWQGRLSGLLTAKEGIPAIKFWILASATTRAKRVAGREGVPYKKALAQITRRDKADRARYLKLYGLDVNDLSVYDAVIPTDNRSAQQVVSALLRSTVRLWPKNKTQPLPTKLRNWRRRQLRLRKK